MEQNLWLPFARLYFSLVPCIKLQRGVILHSFCFDIWDPSNVLLSQSQSYFSTWITVDTHCITKTYDDVIMTSSSFWVDVIIPRHLIGLFSFNPFFQILFPMLSTNNSIGSSRKSTARSILPIWTPLRHLGKFKKKWSIWNMTPEFEFEIRLRIETLKSDPS